MKPIQILFVLFILVPLVEIYLLIRIGGGIGALPTLGLVILTAIIGAWMLRQQGFVTLQRARAVIDSGQIPALEVLEGVVLLIGGALLLTPGFVTDALGFICLFPQTRDWLIKQLLKNIQMIHSEGTPTQEPRSRPRHAHTIEGEWRREDD